MALSTNEQETTIQFSRDDKTCRMWTSDTRMITRMDKLVAEYPDIYKETAAHTIHGEVSDKSYEYPKKYAYPKKPRPEMSEENKEKARMRFTAMKRNNPANANISNIK